MAAGRLQGAGVGGFLVYPGVRRRRTRGRPMGWGSPLLVLPGGLAALRRAGASYPGVNRRTLANFSTCWEVGKSESWRDRPKGRERAGVMRCERQGGRARTGGGTSWPRYGWWSPVLLALGGMRCVRWRVFSYPGVRRCAQRWSYCRGWDVLAALGLLAAGGCAGV